MLHILNTLKKNLEIALDCKICGISHSIMIYANDINMNIVNKPNANSHNNKNNCCGGGCTMF